MHPKCIIRITLFIFTFVIIIGEKTKDKTFLENYISLNLIPRSMYGSLTLFLEPCCLFCSLPMNIEIQVRKSMCRIKQVLNERAIEEPDARRSAEMRRMINGL